MQIKNPLLAWYLYDVYRYSRSRDLDVCIFFIITKLKSTFFYEYALLLPRTERKEKATQANIYGQVLGQIPSHTVQIFG